MPMLPKVSTHNKAIPPSGYQITHQRLRILHFIPSISSSAINLAFPTMVTSAYGCYPSPSLGSPQLGEKASSSPSSPSSTIPTFETPLLNSSNPQTQLTYSSRFAAIRLFFVMSNKSLIRHYVNLTLLVVIIALVCFTTHIAAAQARYVRWRRSFFFNSDFNHRTMRMLQEPITGQ